MNRFVRATGYKLKREIVICRPFVQDVWATGLGHEERSRVYSDNTNAHLQVL